jgi:two-component sensor histidine kinase
MLKTIADMHASQGNLALAQRDLLQVLALYKSIHYPRRHYTYDLISSVYHGMSNYDEALNYAQLALESATVNKDSVDLGSFNLTLGILHDELKQWKSATKYYKKALWYFEQSKNIDMVHVITNSICGGLIAHESPAKALAFCQQISRQHPATSPSSTYIHYLTLAECHLALKEVKTAERYYVHVLALGANKADVSNLTIATYIKVGTFYVIVRQYDKAHTYLERALTLLKQRGLLRGTASVHLQLFKVDSAQGNYSSAIDHYQKYKSLSDSIFNEKKSQQISSLEVQYETKKKEQDIALLTRQNLMQQASIQQKDFQRNSIIAGAILLAGLLGVSYNRYRLKQKSNQLLEAKQVEINQKNQSLEQVLGQKEELLTEKEWMLKEIHHRVKNNLQVISSLLNAQSDFLQDPIALTAIQDSQNRVHAMALIHQKLYQSHNLALVSMPEYIDEIVDHLMESFNRRASVRAVLTVAATELDVSLATPIGLIINEAVTNSLKYAFPANRPGIITIAFQSIADQTYQLSISDNGVGMPIGMDLERSHTLGLTMIRGLSRQIGGQLQIRQESGVQIILEFSQAKKVDRTVWG